MQKISFIRSLLSNTELLLLDESTSNLDLSTSYYNRARITFKTPYPSHQAGNGKLFFHSLAGGNAPFATFNFPRDPSNSSTYQTVEIDLSAAPAACWPFAPGQACAAARG